MSDRNPTRGSINGAVFTTAVETIDIMKTAYTEQTTNAQRSFNSSSANDTSAGTGARTLTLTYYDQTGAGPFTETITMNGTSNVNTASSTICFVESIVVATAGSGGSNAGTITMKAAAAGGGATIATITIGDNQTFWAQHYVPLGKTCYITDIVTSAQINSSTAGALIWLRKTPLGGFVQDITARYHFIGNVGSMVVNYQVPIAVAGPARINVRATTEGTADNNLYCQFNYYEV